MRTFHRADIGEATRRDEEQHQMLHIIPVLDTRALGKSAARLQPLAEPSKRPINGHTTRISE